MFGTESHVARASLQLPLMADGDSELLSGSWVLGLGVHEVLGLHAC